MTDRITSASLLELVNEQAEDEGLWFQPVYASEAYLQAALRRLHEVIEGKSAEQCAIASLTGEGDLGEPLRATRSLEEETKNFIQYNAGGLDDIAIDRVTLFRMERMSETTFWLRLYRENDQDVVFWIGGPSVDGGHQFDTDDETCPDIEVTGTPLPSSDEVAAPIPSPSEDELREVTLPRSLVHEMQKAIDLHTDNCRACKDLSPRINEAIHRTHTSGETELEALGSGAMK